MWIDKKGAGFNKMPLPILKKLTAEEFLSELGSFAAYEKREFRQVREVNMSNVYIYRLQAEGGINLAIAMGNVYEDGKWVANFWKLGSQEDWDIVKGRQSDFFSGDNS